MEVECFEKKTMDFLQQNLHFFKICKSGKFAVECCISNDNNS